MQQNAYFIILCGGSGTRLWPLSRKNRPKHLLKLDGEKTLLEQTIERISPIAKNKKNIGIITTKDQLSLIPKKISKKIGFEIVEPVGRNTGPAILYSCLEIEKINSDATVVFLPADHFIPDTNRYCDYLKEAILCAQKNMPKSRIVTLGLIPTRPATGYGYIQASGACVKRFHEKPTLEKAKEYIKRKDMFWNLGMFVGKTKLFIEEYKKHAPEIFSCVKNFEKNGTGYEKAPSTSIDYAVMEKSKNISLVPCDFEWNDVGNLEMFLGAAKRLTPAESGGYKIINLDCKNNIAKTNKKTIVFIGLDDVCVVEDGDVLVVAKRSDVEKIKRASKPQGDVVLGSKEKS
jgi:mannose-1-phosphate guanylyltransferase/mannose-6-phosphate isomerase